MANKYVYVIEVAHNSQRFPDGTIVSIMMRPEHSDVESFVRDVCIGYSLKPLWDKLIGWANIGEKETEQQIILDAENTIEATFLAKTAYEKYGKK
jgi:hypothetical protein